MRLPGKSIRDICKSPGALLECAAAPLRRGFPGLRKFVRKYDLILDAQISHHFIYNSLQSIMGLCNTDPAAAGSAIDVFSEYLRGNLYDLMERELISFERELELTQAYLELVKLTGNKEFEIEYRLGTTDFLIPPLVLQPLVENAVKYGSSRDGSPVRIVISTIADDARIFIEAENSCGGSDGSGRAHVGLTNVRARLAIKKRGTLKTERTEGSFKATICLKRNRLKAAS